MSDFCTIITPDFLPFAKTLFRNLRSFNKNAQLHVLIVKGDLKADEEFPFLIYSPEKLTTVFASALVAKYGHTNDAQRWSLKPVFLLHLLTTYHKIIYIDCDVFFFNDYAFLFEELDNGSVLLTPHWAPENPFEEEEKFRINFLIGLYNAGCIGVSRKAVRTLEWWATVCLYKIENNTADGFFVDQRYLDLLPVLDENVRLVRHRGCNVGSWNIESNKRSTVDGKALINEIFPVVFIHFNHETIRHILNGNDPHLLPLFTQYESFFAGSGKMLQEYVSSLADWKKTSMVITLKRKISFRSRIKRFLFKLARWL